MNSDFEKAKKILDDAGIKYIPYKEKGLTIIGDGASVASAEGGRLVTADGKSALIPDSDVIIEPEIPHRTC